MSNGLASQRSGLPFAVVPLALTYLAIAVNMTIATIALPTISTEFAATAGELSWVVGVTPMVSAAFLLFGGAWSDRFGRKRMLMIGVLVFLAAAVLSGFATNVETLIALRGLTGFGSALAMPAALALVFDVTAGSAQRTAVGIMAATQAIGALLGPLLGGGALVLFGWQAAFWAVAPLLLVAFVFNLTTLPRDAAHEVADLDTKGALLTAVAGVALLYAATIADDPGQPTLWLAVTVGLVALVALVRWERRASNPLFIGSLLRQPSFVLPTLAVVTVQFVLGGLLFLNTQYIQLVLGFSALGAGLFLMPALLAWTASAATAGVTTRRFGTRAVVVVASILGAAGLILIATGGASPTYPILIGGLALFGLLGVVPAVMTHAAVSNYGTERRSVGSAINSMAMRYGLAFGVSFLGMIHTVVYRRQLLSTPPGAAVGEQSEAAESLGGAFQVAGAGDAGLIEAAQSSFASGFTVVLVVSAALVGALALVMWTFLGRSPQLTGGLTA